MLEGTGEAAGFQIRFSCFLVVGISSERRLYTGNRSARQQHASSHPRQQGFMRWLSAEHHQARRVAVASPPGAIERGTAAVSAAQHSTGGCALSRSRRTSHHARERGGGNVECSLGSRCADTLVTCLRARRRFVGNSGRSSSHSAAPPISRLRIASAAEIVPLCIGAVFYAGAAQVSRSRAS